MYTTIMLYCKLTVIFTVFFLQLGRPVMFLRLVEFNAVARISGSGLVTYEVAVGTQVLATFHVVSVESS